MADAGTHWEDLIKSSITDSFHHEAVVEIILRLPMKSICRFKCVCKSWNSSFSDPEFVMRQMLSAFNGGDFVLLEHEFTNADRETYCLRDCESFAAIGYLKLPIEITFGYFEVIDCCNGLICLAESSYAGYILASSTVIWNPAIKEFKVFPACRVYTSYRMYEFAAWGFAYDASANDYKFVRILRTHRKMYETEVYSLLTDSWKHYDVGITGSLQDGMTQAFTNSKLHWMGVEEPGENYSGHYILTFDVMKCTVGKIVLPSFGCENKAIETGISLCRGCLCPILLRTYTLVDDCDIWVMDKYGDPASWSKLYTISFCIDHLVPIGVLDGGKLVVQVSGGLILLCDCFTNEKKTHCIGGPTCVIKYWESLVSPKGLIINNKPVPAQLIIGEKPRTILYCLFGKVQGSLLWDMDLPEHERTVEAISQLCFRGHAC